MRIALVDDSEQVRTQLSQYIKRFEDENDIRLEVSQFPSGDALLEGYRPVYDIIVFDIDMPGTYVFAFEAHNIEDNEPAGIPEKTAQ